MLFPMVNPASLLFFRHLSRKSGLIQILGSLLLLALFSALHLLLHLGHLRSLAVILLHVALPA
jgi:hypothetical protein